MTGERIALQPAYVLHRRPYRETSLLVEAFTAEHGRVGLIAKGVRRGKGRLQGVLQPFHPLLLSWSGRGELRSLTDAEGRGPVPVLSGRTIYSAFYLNELLLRLTEREDPHPALFAHYGETLAALCEDEEWALRLFERDLLSELGYGLALETDVDGEPIAEDALYDYQAEIGAIRCGDVPTVRAISGRALLVLGGRVPPDEQSRREVKKLLRRVLRLYLGTRPLESRVLYASALGLQDNEEEQP
ncbi:MAG: DNA repair protein RecO [Thiohalomonadaceae bacterium]